MKSASRRVYVHCCKLRRRDLDALFEKAGDGFSDSALLLFSTERGVAKITAKSLDEMLSDYGSSDRLANLEVHFFDPAADVTDPIKSVLFQIDTRHAYVRVKGIDETWVRGRADELKEMLRRTRPKFAIHPRSSALAGWLFTLLGALGLFLLPGTLTVTVLQTFFPSHSRYNFGVWPYVTLVFLALCGGIWPWYRRRITTEILLDESPDLIWTRADKIALIVGVLTLIVGLAGIGVTISS